MNFVHELFAHGHYVGVDDSLAKAFGVSTQRNHRQLYVGVRWLPEILEESISSISRNEPYTSAFPILIPTHHLIQVLPRLAASLSCITCLVAIRIGVCMLEKVVVSAGGMRLLVHSAAACCHHATGLLPPPIRFERHVVV